MARSAKGSVYRPVVGRVKNGRRVNRRAKFYWAHYRDARGEERRHVLKLSNGMRITEKDVARAELTEIQRRIEREAAGLVDRRLEFVKLPLRLTLAQYARYLRRKRCTPKHIHQVIQTVKWVADKADMRRLADLDEDRIDKALGALADMGRSARTINVYRRCLASMAEWAVRIARILDRNPVRAVERRDEEADRRKVRRSLTIDEASRLLDAGGTGRLFYHTQAWSGLRVGETLGLEWRDLELEADRPALRLRAEATKARRADELPLHPTLAAALVEVRPKFALPTDRVFTSVPSIEQFRRDLRAAGIPLEDKRGRAVDRHALRTTFISWLGQYGVDPRAQIVLARHAPTGITLRAYQDFSVFDLWAEIAKLPGPGLIVAKGARATGTEGAKGVVRPVVLEAGRRGANLSASGRSGAKRDTSKTTAKPLRNRHIRVPNAVSAASGAEVKFCQTGSPG